MTAHDEAVREAGIAFAKTAGPDEGRAADVIAAYLDAMKVRGWRMVPVEMSTDHCLAAWDKMRAPVRKRLDSSVHAKAAYRAAMDAAPDPRHGGEG